MFNWIKKLFCKAPKYRPNWRYLVKQGGNK